MRGIKYKILMSYLLMILMIIGMIFVFQIVLLEKYYIYERTNTLNFEIDKIAQTISSGSSGDIESNEFFVEAENSLRKINARITVIKGKSEPIYISMPTRFGPKGGIYLPISARWSRR